MRLAMSAACCGAESRNSQIVSCVITFQQATVMATKRSQPNQTANWPLVVRWRHCGWPDAIC